MEPAFTQGWIDRLSSVYAEKALVEVPWFTAAPSLKLIEAAINESLHEGALSSTWAVEPAWMRSSWQR